jgi:hypothetical protein
VAKADELLSCSRMYDACCCCCGVCQVFVVFLDLMNEGMGRPVFSFVIKHVCVGVCACPKK